MHGIYKACRQDMLRGPRRPGVSSPPPTGSGCPLVTGASWAAAAQCEHGRGPWVLAWTPCRIGAHDEPFPLESILIHIVQFGVPRGHPPVWRRDLPGHAQLGWASAMRFLLTAEEFGATEALRIGLVQEVVPPVSSSTGRWRSPARSPPRRRLGSGNP